MTNTDREPPRLPNQNPGVETFRVKRAELRGNEINNPWANFPNYAKNLAYISSVKGFCFIETPVGTYLQVFENLTGVNQEEENQLGALRAVLQAKAGILNSAIEWTDLKGRSLEEAEEELSRNLAGTAPEETIIATIHLTD